MLTPEANARLERLLQRYTLHSFLPAPIRQVAVDQGWTLVYRERIHPIYGVIVIVGTAQVMLINASISPEWQRFAIAHELGHVVNGDEGALHMLEEQAGNWWNQRGERAANVIAARMLIPDKLIEEGVEPDEIARRCEAPVQLVQWRYTWPS